MAERIARYLAENILSLRKNRGMSQERFSNLSTLPRSTIAHLESGESNPSLQVLLKLSNALKISVEELISRPTPLCKLTKAAEFPKENRPQNQGCLYNLLPEKVPGLQLERIDLPPQQMFIGTPHTQGTREYYIGMSGIVQISIAGESYKVEAGDVLSFSGDFRHVYKNIGSIPASGISVIALNL